jgi:hypothetical protein
VVGKIWKTWGLQPWRAETFKFSTDPELEAKVRDVVGLYLNLPDKAVVLCVDEKSQVQALDRTAPIMPGLPEKATHDYVRHGTTTLFAALEVATGRVEQACLPRHRHQEFLRLEAGCEGLPAAQAAPGGRQLRHPQASRGEGMAGAEPADHPALHPDQRVLAEHGRDLLRSSPARPSAEAASAASRTWSLRSGGSSTAGTSAAIRSSRPRPPTS